MRGIVAICLLACGCDVVWRLDDLHGVPDAAGPGDGDAAGCVFMPRVLIQNIAGSHDPTLSDDGLELFFVRGGVGNYDIWHAVRASTSMEFTMGLAVAEFVTPSSEETDPALSADGKLIVFKSTRNSTPNRAWQATRAGRGQPFSTPYPVPGLENTSVGGLDISPDGLTIYYDDLAKLVMATRASIGQPFSATMMINVDRAQYPSVSADGLELLYSAGGVIRRTRPTSDEMFDGGTAAAVDSGGADADITADNTRIVLSGGGGLIYQRDRCP